MLLIFCLLFFRASAVPYYSHGHPCTVTRPPSCSESYCHCAGIGEPLFPCGGAWPCDNNCSQLAGQTVFADIFLPDIKTHCLIVRDSHIIGKLKGGSAAECFLVINSSVSGNVELKEGNDVLYVYGSTVGNVDAHDGDDVVVFDSSSSHSGDVNGGNGDDRMEFCLSDASAGGKKLKGEDGADCLIVANASLSLLDGGNSADDRCFDASGVTALDHCEFTTCPPTASPSASPTASPTASPSPHPTQWPSPPPPTLFPTPPPTPTPTKFPTSPPSLPPLVAPPSPPPATVAPSPSSPSPPPSPSSPPSSPPPPSPSSPTAASAAPSLSPPPPPPPASPSAAANAAPSRGDDGGGVAPSLLLLVLVAAAAFALAALGLFLCCAVRRRRHGNARLRRSPSNAPPSTFATALPRASASTSARASRRHSLKSSATRSPAGQWMMAGGGGGFGGGGGGGDGDGDGDGSSVSSGGGGTHAIYDRIGIAMNPMYDAPMAPFATAASTAAASAQYASNFRRKAPSSASAVYDVVTMPTSPPPIVYEQLPPAASHYSNLMPLRKS